MSYTVAQNTSFLTAASVLQKVISFFYFTIIARMIGVENTGAYFFAIAFTTIFAVAADFGFAPILTRETAKYPEQSEKYINTILWTKFFFGLLAYGLVVLGANVLNYPVETKILIYVSGITMFLDNFHSGFYSIFRARKNLVYEASGIVGAQILTMIIGTIALALHWPLVWLILAYTIPSFINVIYSGYCVHRVFGVSYHFTFDRQVFKMFLGLAAPFFLAGIIGRLYSYSDSLIMSKMLSQKEMGWWSVPYKIAFAFQFIPSALSASVYPAMSAFTVTAPEKIGELFAKSWRYLFAIVFPVAAGIIALSHPIVVFLYTKNYLPSVPVLQILMISLIFGFLAFITGATLNATNHQRWQTGLMAVVLIVNITLNIDLLPRLGIMGAALSAMISNVVLCLGGLYLAKRFVVIDGALVAKYFAQTFIPATVMGLVVFWLSSHIHFLITIPIGAMIYGGLLFVGGGVDRELIGRLVSKVRGRESSAV